MKQILQSGKQTEIPFRVFLGTARIKTHQEIKITSAWCIPSLAGRTEQFQYRYVIGIFLVYFNTCSLFIIYFLSKRNNLFVFVNFFHIYGVPAHTPLYYP